VDPAPLRPPLTVKAPASDSARVRDAASLLPLLGLFLLMPPVITLFAAAVSVSGVPLIVVYVFGVWAALVVCAGLLARRLGRVDADGVGDDPPP